MKIKHLLTNIVAGLILLTFTTSAVASYSLMLPDTPCTPPLPYIAEADHYSGPACIQMALNACPNISERHYNNQNDIYSSILLHNAEPAEWFSDPSGIRGALQDPVFSPCGHWVDYSNTDKNYVLGKMLYYMKTQRYLTPVSISSSEHWVIVMGYQTDVEPPYSGTVNLQNIIFYEPLPGNPSVAGLVSGTVWLSDSDYWGIPHNKPGSSWHNKYIAIIEPPGAIPRIRVPKWILKGRILPIPKIKQYFYRWIEEMRKEDLTRGPLKILRKDVRTKEPILVRTGKYSYYLVPFEDRRLAAIFNAYNGSFEEFRYFQRPQKVIVEPKTVVSKLSKTLRLHGAEGIKVGTWPTPELRYDPGLAIVGRFSPTWKVQAIVKDAKGKIHKLPISLDSAGQVIKGLEELEKKPRLPQSRVISTIKVPETYPQGLVLVKDHLWIIDSKSRALLKIDEKRKKVVDSLKTTITAPRGLAWDGKNFWCADNKTKMVHQIDPLSGKIIRSVKVPIYGKQESAVLEAVAWDGKNLWIAFGAGWSSRICKMDVNTGEIVQSMFANCYPRGLATDGKNLWVVSYNQGKYPGVVSRRTIMDDSKKMNLSRAFLCRVPGKEPTGITFDGKYLWVADKDMKSLQRIELLPKR